ncbi:MAG TPA: hypothetical protein PKA93_10940 [Arachnia sp.]|nr:hypothetical protein [Arachnia sp.]
MSVARSRTGWQVASAVLLTAVVGWTAAPTFPMVWGIDPSLGQPNPVTYHSWLDPVVPFGGAALHAPLTFVCALVAAAGAWYGLAVKRTRRAPAWWALAGAVILVGWSAVLSSFQWQQAVALVGLLGGAGAALLAARGALPPLLK